MSKIRLALVPKRTVQPSLFVTIIKCDGHYDNVSLETKRKENMAKKDKAPRYVRVANVMTTALLARYFGVTADSSLEEFEQAMVSHPLFVLQLPLVQGRPQAEREELRFSRAHFQQ